jgi:hypothetical protein
METKFKVGDKIRLKNKINEQVITKNHVLIIDTIGKERGFNNLSQIILRYIYRTHIEHCNKLNGGVFNWNIWDDQGFHNLMETELIENYELAGRKILKLKDFIN